MIKMAVYLIALTPCLSLTSSVLLTTMNAQAATASGRIIFADALTSL